MSPPCPFAMAEDSDVWEFGLELTTLVGKG
jgi:hypothetical protein